MVTYKKFFLASCVLGASVASAKEHTATFVKAVRAEAGSPILMVIGKDGKTSNLQCHQAPETNEYSLFMTNLAQTASKTKNFASMKNCTDQLENLENADVTASAPITMHFNEATITSVEYFWKGNKKLF